MATAGAAFGATSRLYLIGDGVPAASLSFNVPSAGSLPDHDFDGDPGLTIQRGGVGPSESFPGRYQQWEYDASGASLAVSGLTIWAAEKGMKGNEHVVMAGYLLLCNSRCELLDVSTTSLHRSSGWTKVELDLSEPARTYSVGDHLVVKVIVTDDSSDDMWFAYGSQSQNASLGVVMSPSAPATAISTLPGVITAPTDLTTSTSSSTTTLPEKGSSTSFVAGGTGGSGTGAAGLAERGGGFDIPRGNDMFRPGAFDDAENLRPQEGLMIAYATVAESVELYWQVAVALGALMTILLLAGFEEMESENDPGRRLRWTTRLRRI